MNGRNRSLLHNILNKPLRAPCAYPRGKTAGIGAENQKRRATLKVKTAKTCHARAKSTGNGLELLRIMNHVANTVTMRRNWLLLLNCSVHNDSCLLPAHHAPPSAFCIEYKRSQWRPRLVKFSFCFLVTSLKNLPSVVARASDFPR
jgi:hypothetical protein